MEERIPLNSLLNLTEEELSNAKVKFNQWNGNVNPMEEYQKNPEIVNESWLFYRTTQRYFRVGQIAICFLKLSKDTWLMTTIKRITKELNVTNGKNYEGEEIERLKPFFGRVIVRYRKTHQSQGIFAKKAFDKMEVAQILPSVFDGEDFPGYDRVRLSYEQLEMIVTRKNEIGLRHWNIKRLFI